MIDYLTELPEPGEGALERALRRVEDALAGGGPGRSGGTEEREPAPAGAADREEPEEGIGEAARSPEEGAGRVGSPFPAPGLEDDAAGDGGGTGGGFAQAFTRPESWPEAQPLAEALARADRRAARAAALTGGEPPPAEPERRRAEGREWTAPGRSPRNRAAGGELETARQVDRAFRRDSRRYDGGFFLY